MASNHTQQSNVEELVELASEATANRPMQQSLDRGVHCLVDVGAETSKNNLIESTLQTCDMPPDNHEQCGDVQTIRNRQVRFNQRERRQLELLCEEKISKHKLEEVHCSLPSSIKSTFIMTFSPDGQRVASTHGDHRIYICDLNTGKLLDTLEGHPKTPWCLAWHPSNKEILASGCLAGEVRVWDLRSKACESWTSENHTIISSLDFHPKERVLVIATANDILFWDWSESTPFAKTKTMHDREKVKFVVFDSSGTKLITGISNLPKYSGYSSDSLQNRIIDGYLSQGPIETLPTENMTQNSEITTSPAAGIAINANENLERQNANSAEPRSAAASGGARSGSDDTNRDIAQTPQEQDINYRNTLLLSRVASLYRQLESLEDSMRHTSFAPFINLRPVANPSSVDVTTDNSSSSVFIDRNCQNQQSENGTDSSTTVRSKLQAPTTATGSSQQSPPPIKNEVPSQDRHDPNLHPAPNSTTAITAPLASTFEPYLVTFDELLEQLQLPTLIMEGRSIDLATVIDQYPIDLSRQMHHAMQFESINQVNQNFIRISKLMSSARLYRHLVQQISSNSEGNVPFQPNQILSAQSVSPRSPRHSPNIPIVLRNYSLANSVDTSGLIRHSRTHDPIMAIEFRNTARNVPLTTICKIDLLAARAICILRSQNLVEQAIANARPLTSGEAPSSETVSVETTARPTSETINQRSATSDRTDASETLSVQSILGNLHSTLTMINHAPLTTSNAYIHITNLRVILGRLHTALSASLRSPVEGQRLSDLMHNIAFSLTNRRWSVPLGATLNEIRLDVIHTLCIVDLILHFVRQIQLLQMTRVSLIARVEESRRPGGAIVDQMSANSTTVELISPPSGVAGQADGSSSSSSSGGARLSGASKRKHSELKYDVKRMRTSSSSQSNADFDSLPDLDNVARLDQTSDASGASAAVPIIQTLAGPNATSPSDRMVIWNSPQSQIEQSLQRILVASSSNLSTNHILVRVYHRMHGMPGYPAIADPLIERATPLQVESRRRALSQDNAAEQHQQDSIDVSPNGVINSVAAAAAQAHHRVRPPAAYQANFHPHGPSQPPPPHHHHHHHHHHHLAAVPAYEGWQGTVQRHPHIHLYQARAPGQHLWFNQWTIPLPMNNSNFRLQCWNFSRSLVPNIKDTQLNLITQKCRLYNDSSVDLSSDGTLLACLVPREEGYSCFPGFELKIFSLKAHDFGSCYYKLLQGHNALTVSLSPSGSYVVVGLATHKSLNYEQNEDDLKIGKVFKLSGGNSIELVRDIKVKRDDSSLCLNAIKWMPRGIVYSVGPQHMQRYQTARMRNVVAS